MFGEKARRERALPSVDQRRSEPPFLHREVRFQLTRKTLSERFTVDPTTKAPRPNERGVMLGREATQAYVAWLALGWVAHGSATPAMT